MPTTTLNQLKTHPAQMRTTHDLNALATLTLQIHTRGLNSWQPIVAAPNGDGAHIVSGHRRHMAQLLAHAFSAWLAADPDRQATLEAVQAMLGELLERHGSLAEAVTALLDKYGDKPVDYVAFEGTPKAEILALQAANYGSESPDTLGVATSFRKAVEAGATPEEIARNVGQPLVFVANHLALTQIPEALAARIAAGDLPLSVAAAVADLPQPKRSGLAIFILANLAADAGPGGGQTAGRLTAKEIKRCAVALKKWSGLHLPLVVKHQSQRNIARALVRLWGQVVEAYPNDAYAAAAMFIYRDVHEEPWTNPEKLALWFQALGGDTYFADGRIHWPALVGYLLSEISCASCPIASLPVQILRSDLAQGQGGVLGMPCRAPQSDSSEISGEIKGCLHGLSPDDPFDVRVPWDWADHDGVVSEGGVYRVKSIEALKSAWEAQAAIEAAADEAPAKQPAKRQETTEIPAGSAASNKTLSPLPAEAPTTPSPIVRQRAQITDFMKRHEKFSERHPFATPCGRCRHQLEASPTKDEAVPHCTWAGRLRAVEFKTLEARDANPADGRRLTIPVCRQFAPSDSWAELIPPHPEPPGLPRDWLKRQILALVEAANRHGTNRNAFEFLTGRPLSSGETYGGWFKKQLDEQIGELSDAQLFTLLVWAHAEWGRARRLPFPLPVKQGMQFVTVEERPWSIDSE